MKAIIIDSDPVASRHLTSLITDCDDRCQIIGIAADIQSGVKLLTSQQPDLVFLDTTLEDGSGFELLNQIHTPDFQLVFVSTQHALAFEAFRFHALDYLLKPVEPDRVRATIERAHLRLLGARFTRRSPGQEHPKIALRDADGFYLTDLADIIQVKSYKNYCTFHLMSGQTHTVSKTLAYYDSCLANEGFFRAHQSHLINMRHVRQMKKKAGVLILSDGAQIPLSQRKRETFAGLLARRPSGAQTYSSTAWKFPFEIYS